MSVNKVSFDKVLDRSISQAGKTFASDVARIVYCDPSEIEVHAIADHDVVARCTVVKVEVIAPTLRKPVAGEVRIADAAISRLDAQPKIYTSIAGLFVSLKAHITRELQTLLTFDAKQMIAVRKKELTNPIAQQRAKSLEAIERTINEGRLSVRDVDQAIEAARMSMLSTEQIMQNLKRARNQGRNVTAIEVADDLVDAVSYSLGSTAPTMVKGKKRKEKSETSLYIKDTLGNKHHIGDLKDIHFDPMAIDFGKTDHLTMRCSSCGGQARLVDGEFGLAGASYRCDSCGIMLADCIQCRAIYARRDNQECPRCETRARKER